MITITTETVAAVRNRQVIWLDWMKQATAGLADDALIITTTKCTPFGNYLLEIERNDACDGCADPECECWSLFCDRCGDETLGDYNLCTHCVTNNNQ